MKLMIIGHARHGKDTVCEILHDQYGLTFQSSSDAACQLFIYNLLRDAHGYSTIEECFNDRVNHRDTWYRLISEYCADDKTALARAIFANHSVYCGSRNADEFAAVKAAGLFDYCVWVDASQRHPAEPASSCSLSRADADFVLDNNGTLEELQANIAHMIRWMHALNGNVCKCGAEQKTQDEIEFLGWHGHCVACAMQEVGHG